MSKQSDLVTVARDAGASGYVNVAGDTMTDRLNISKANDDRTFLISAGGGYGAFTVASGSDNTFFGYAASPTHFNANSQAGDACIRSNNGVSISGNNGTNGMRIDSAGRVTMPYQPAFHVLREAGHVYGTGSRVTVVYDTVQHNQGGHYNSSTGVFTAPVAGRYLFMAVGMSAYNQSGDKQLAIHVNGSLKNISNPASTGSDGARPFAATLLANLAANDTVYVSFYSNNSSDYLYAAGGFWNGFNGYLIG